MSISALSATAFRNTAQRSLVRSRRALSNDGSSFNRLNLACPAVAASCFVAFKVVEEEQSVDVRFTRSQARTGGDDPCETVQLFHHDGYFEPVLMEEMVDEYGETLRRALGAATSAAIDLMAFLNTKTTELLEYTNEERRKQAVVSKEEESCTEASFPSLAAHVVAEDEGHQESPMLTELQLNSNLGIPIENELFSGRMMLILRPLHPDDDPRFLERLNGNDKVTFDLRLQGRFKYVPTGDVYCGAETTKTLPLNSLTKGLSRIFLGLLANHFGTNMEYSFGNLDCTQRLDKPTSRVRPFIAFPLHTTMDAFIVTKPDQRPPPLEEPLVRWNGRTARNKAKGEDFGRTFTPNEGVLWNTEDTYSMSLSAGALDLATWKAKQPFTMDLSTMWGKDSLLRLVIYEKDKSSEEKKYLLAIQLKHMGDSYSNKSEVIDK